MDPQYITLTDKQYNDYGYGEDPNLTREEKIEKFLIKFENYANLSLEYFKTKDWKIYVSSRETVELWLRAMSDQEFKTECKNLSLDHDWLKMEIERMNEVDFVDYTANMVFSNIEKVLEWILFI